MEGESEELSEKDLGIGRDDMMYEADDAQIPPINVLKLQKQVTKPTSPRSSTTRHYENFLYAIHYTV